MMALLAIVLATAVPASLAAAVHFYREGHRARQSLAILQRLSSNEGAAAPVLSGVRPERLAGTRRMQDALRDMPLVTEAAELLEQSGLKTTVAELLRQIVLAAGGAFAGGRLLGMLPAPAFLFAMLTAVVPVALVSRARNLRAAAFEAQLPQALELIALYLRSGRSLPQAFIGATEELLPPAAEEFAACAEEYRLGRPLEASLRGLAQKFPGSTGFRLFSVAVSVLGQTGGNLVEVLERIKRTLAAGTAYAQRLRALTGESRMSAWILGALPGIFMLGATLLNPAYFNVFLDSNAGRIMLVAFLTLWFSGIAWIRNLMQSGGS